MGCNSGDSGRHIKVVLNPMPKHELPVVNNHLVLKDDSRICRNPSSGESGGFKKHHKKVLTILTAESRFRILERINGRPYDPDDVWQEEGGSG